MNSLHCGCHSLISLPSACILFRCRQDERRYAGNRCSHCSPLRVWRRFRHDSAAGRRRLSLPDNRADCLQPVMTREGSACNHKAPAHMLERCRLSMRIRDDRSSVACFCAREMLRRDIGELGLRHWSRSRKKLETARSPERLAPREVVNEDAGPARHNPQSGWQSTQGSIDSPQIK